MQISTLQGIIARRILVNYRVEPEYLQRLLPAPFRPKLIHGKGMAGICLIRFKQLRPRRFPALLGLASENAAHRIAVEWDESGIRREGVYIPRRDTNSQFTSVVGGKLFPSVLYHARFQVTEEADNFSIQVASDDGETQIAVAAQLAAQLPESSIFTSAEEASAFFEQGSVGLSITKEPGKLDNIEINCENWRVEPLRVTSVRSSFFDDQERFPAGTVALDCALVMRSIRHEWHVQEPFHVTDQDETPRQTIAASSQSECP